MAHFNPNDVLVTQWNSTTLLDFLHCDSDGVLIDTHTAVQDDPGVWTAGVDYITHYGKYLYITMGTNIKRWDLDGNDLGIWYDEIGETPDIVALFHHMYFDDTTGDAIIVRNRENTALGTSFSDIIRVNQAGVRIATYPNPFGTGSSAASNAHLCLVPTRHCSLLQGGGGNGISLYDVCLNSGTIDLFYTDADHIVTIYGVVADKVNNLVYGGIGKFPGDNTSHLSGYYVFDRDGNQIDYHDAKLQSPPGVVWIPRDPDIQSNGDALWAASESATILDTVSKQYIGKYVVSTDTWLWAAPNPGSDIPWKVCVIKATYQGLEKVAPDTTLLVGKYDGF